MVVGPWVCISQSVCWGEGGVDKLSSLRLAFVSVSWAFVLARNDSVLPRDRVLKRSQYDVGSQVLVKCFIDFAYSQVPVRHFLVPSPQYTQVTD